MKPNNSRLIIFAVIGISLFGGACSAQKDTVTPGSITSESVVAGLPNGATLPVLSGINVMNLTVNGNQCAAGSYPNKPCVSVTICAPGTTNCQTINDILLDTGSYGLRLFKSVISVPLVQVDSGANALAECVQYGDGTSDWGPVQKADVVLGGEPAVSVPIQVIDSTFVGGATNCSGADVSPSVAGFNGILGVGLFGADCGADCATQANNKLYYSCSGSSCTGTVVPLTNQVQNPVSLLAQDNNGVIVELPSIPLSGQTAVNGYLVLGIGTRSNNQPTGVNVFTASASTGQFSTAFNGHSYDSFLDSGSNGLFFAAPSSLPDCGGNLTGWFCPSSMTNLSAVNTPTSGLMTSSVAFQVGSITTLGSANNNVFLDIGGNGGNQFDWGLPFYIGRNIFVGIEGTKATFGSVGAQTTGPYWAY